jgi:hypothetical protein
MQTAARQRAHELRVGDLLGGDVAHRVIPPPVLPVRRRA